MGEPQPGQVPGFTKVVPHRVQNFEFSSIAGFPQVGQAMIFRTGPPHLSQNCASGSATIAPHVLQTGNWGSGSSTIADPHRLQNFDSPSGAGIPQLPHFLVMCVLRNYRGPRHKTCGSGGEPDGSRQNGYFCVRTMVTPSLPQRGRQRKGSNPLTPLFFRGFSQTSEKRSLPLLPAALCLVSNSIPDFRRLSIP